jgi:DNA-binding beta-propeller fold protein YncE
MPDFKTVKVKPMTGAFDTLSSADEIGFGNWKIVKNAVTRSNRSRERGGGWRRLFADDDPYNNQDLHDQLTDHLGYYETFQDHAMGGGGLSGYGYTYFASAYLAGATSVYPPASGPFAPVYLGDFPELFYGPCPIFYPYVGYPYIFDARPDLAGQGVTTGPPNFYLYSYVYTSCPVDYSGTIQPGYPYGPQFPMYDPAFSYDFTYCGDYLYNRPGCREAITMLNEIVTATGRKLIAATMSRIYELNQSSGNWRVLADGLGNSGYTLDQCGCNAVRGISATMGSYFIFTNNFDPPAIYFLGDEPAECSNQSVLPITDLDALGIQRAGGVVVWKGFIIFYDITEDGVRMGSTIIWSDLEDPTFIESDTSFAGRATVAVGETILSAATLGNWLILYTDKSIIRVSLVGGEDVFNFENIYKGGNALKYKYSLTNCGDFHIYLGESDIYLFSQFDTRPINVDWVTKAGGFIFNGAQEDDMAYLPINKEACDLVTGGWSEEKREAWLSWPTGDNICPDVTLRLNFKFGAADFVDHGFTAFLTFRRDLRPTIGQWLEDFGVCPRGTLVAAGVRDGDVCMGPGVEVENPPLYIRNPEEDPDLPIHSDSLCARLEGRSLDDFCDDCAAPAVFITASAIDFTLKQQEDNIYYRERLAVLAPPCADVRFATEAGAEEGFEGASLILDAWLPLPSAHCTRLNSITGYQTPEEPPEEVEDMPLNHAVYDATRDVIFAVRGGYVYSLNATTGARIASARFFDNGFYDSYIAYSFSDDKLYVTAWDTDSGNEPSATRRQKWIYRINPDTLAIENSFNFQDMAFGIVDEEYFESGPRELIATNGKLFGLLFDKSQSGNGCHIYVWDVGTDTLEASSVNNRDLGFSNGLTFDSDNNLIWVGTQTGASSFDLAGNNTDQIAITQDTGTPQPKGVCYRSGHIYFAVYEGTLVQKYKIVKVRISDDANTVIDLIDTAANPKKIRYNSVNDRIYVPGRASDTVFIIDPNTDTIESVKGGFDTPIDVVFTPTKAWAVQHGSIGLKEIV